MGGNDFSLKWYIRRTLVIVTDHVVSLGDKKVIYTQAIQHLQPP